MFKRWMCFVLCLVAQREMWSTERMTRKSLPQPFSLCTLQPFSLRTPQPSFTQHSTTIFSPHSTAILFSTLRSHPSRSTPQPSFSQHSTVKWSRIFLQSHSSLQPCACLLANWNDKMAKYRTKFTSYICDGCDV